MQMPNHSVVDQSFQLRKSVMGARKAEQRPLPLYKQIKNDILQQIATEGLATGDTLPTRIELAMRYNTARATVDRALQELTREGVVSGTNGKRTTVISTTAALMRIAVVWKPTDIRLSRKSGEFFGDLTSGIEQACADLQLEVHFRTAEMDDCEQVMRETGARGLLALRPQYSDCLILEHLRDKGIAVVAVPGILEEHKLPSISSDNHMGIGQAVEHLVDLGHRSIGFISLQATVPDQFERLQAWFASMQKHHLTIEPGSVCLAHENIDASYTAVLDNWCKRTHLPTAFIAGDFLMALSLLNVLQQSGVRVPEDVSIVCYDDPPAASHVAPPLTVVRQSIATLGQRAVENLVTLIKGNAVPASERIPTEFIVRKSTARPPFIQDERGALSHDS
jgi:DNA-binding LacI/PurR family transcriptional regulator